MGDFRILEVKQSVFADNDKRAAEVRRELKEKKVFLLNLMSSPGSGKTTTLTRTIEALKGEMKIAVMEADIDSDVDAKTISDLGVKAIQLHTGGMCHLDADMTYQGLSGLNAGDVDLVVLENVGNLVCPAEFDTGAVKNAMILSVPEGDDKPLKYPLMFSVCDVVLINKTDVLPYFDFNMEACKENILKRNPKAKIIPICAKTGECVKITTEDPEYWGLECIVTDEMAEVALKMKVRKPKTLEEIAKLTGKDKKHLEELLAEMAYVGLIEYNWENPRREKQYILPMFVPGSAEFTNMRQSQLEEHPQLGRFFERMTFEPLEKVTPMVPPGGAGIGMHVIPVEKAIRSENNTASVEQITHWLKSTRANMPQAPVPAVCQERPTTRAAGTTWKIGASAWEIWRIIWWRPREDIILHITK